MRIVVNDIAASEGGALSILRDFYDEIVSSDDNNDWIFLLGDDYLEPRDNIKIITLPSIKKSWKKRLEFDFFNGKKIIKKFEPDLYISLQNTATLGLKCQQVVYLHQPLPYQKEKKYSIFKRKERKYAVYQFLIGNIFNILLKKSGARIIVQSQWMKKNVSKKISNSIDVIPPKINKYIEERYFFSEESYKEQKEKQFFYPASMIPYKNHELIFKAVNELLGENINNFSVYLTIDKKMCEHYLEYIPSNIKFLGNIDRKRVFDMYTNSVLLFPSYIETFGLPLLEAKLVNSPIISSKTEFSKEILFDYDNVYYFEKNDYLKLKKIMESFIKNDFEVFEKKLEENIQEVTLYNYLIGEEFNND